MAHFAIILAAGQGTRMKSVLPKVLHKITGLPMVSHVLATVDSLGVEKSVVVIAENMTDVKAQVAPNPTVIQKQQLGTADAVKSAKPELLNVLGNILILYGDTPLIKKETLEAMIQERQKGADVVVLGFRPKDPARYGRLVVDASGLKEIVEFKDANEDQRKITLCNSGVMCVDGAKLFPLLDQITNNNKAGEYYLTDIVALARSAGGRVSVVEGNEEEMAGANSRSDLAMIEKIAQNRLRERFLSQGVTMTDPATVYFSFDTKLGQDVTIEPNVFFGMGMVVSDGVEIKAFSHLEGAVVGKGAIIGPYARLRQGAKIAQGCHIGNFVEIKNSNVEMGAKVNHLSYIGDASIGSKTNIGAGTITCNYDGYFKSKTVIGAGAFIGSNTSLVAPVIVGEGAIIAAGSTITKNVPQNALTVARGKQVVMENWAVKYREKKQTLKNKEAK